MSRKSPIDCAAAGEGCSAEDAEPLAKGALEADLGRLPSGARGLIAQRRAQGLMVREWVYDLHVGQGLPLLQVARTLGLSLKLVSYHWRKLQKQIIANAPRSPDDFAVLRERIGAMLWQTIQLTCQASGAEASSFVLRTASMAPRASSFALPDAVVTTEDVSEARPAGHAKASKAEVCVGAAEPVPPPPMLAIRLRALEQLARLYDLGLDARAPAFAPQPYATSEEIAQSVRERMLELHERGANVLSLRAFGQP